MNLSGERSCLYPVLQETLRTGGIMHLVYVTDPAQLIRWAFSLL